MTEIKMALEQAACSIGDISVFAREPCRVTAAVIVDELIIDSTTFVTRQIWKRIIRVNETPELKRPIAR